METAYENLGRETAGIDHQYGEGVRILAEPYTQSILTEMCHGQELW